MSKSKLSSKLDEPELGDWVDAYDVYGGLGLLVDQNKYQNKLSQMGLEDKIRQKNQSLIAIYLAVRL